VFRLVEVLVQCVGGVDRVEFFGCISAGVFEDDFGAAGVFWWEVLAKVVVGVARGGLLERRELGIGELVE